MSGELLKILRNKDGGVDFATTDDGTGTQLPSHRITGNRAVLIQAQFDNTDRLAVGLTDDPVVQLEAGQAIEYQVANTAQIRIVAASSGDGVNVTAEQNTE
jgi:hypothetical protein